MQRGPFFPVHRFAGVAAMATAAMRDAITTRCGRSKYRQLMVFSRLTFCRVWGWNIPNKAVPGFNMMSREAVPNWVPRFDAFASYHATQRGFPDVLGSVCGVWDQVWSLQAVMVSFALPGRYSLHPQPKDRGPVGSVSSGFFADVGPGGEDQHQQSAVDLQGLIQQKGVR